MREHHTSCTQTDRECEKAAWRIPGWRAGRFGVLSFTALVVSVLLAGAVTAQPQEVREIYVPYEDLNVLLQQAPRRVLVDREEYARLLKAAKVEDDTDLPPVAGAALSAEHRIQVVDGRVLLRSSIVFEALKDELQAVQFGIDGVGLIAATIDGKPLPVARPDPGRLIAFVEGSGLHRLELMFTAPLQTTAAEQWFRFRLPSAAAEQTTLEVAGDVEVKSGASVVSRRYDEAARKTVFEIVLPKQTVELHLSLNSHTLQEKALILGRSVLVDRVTRAYEQLDAVVAFDIRHRAVQQLDLSIPGGFEVTKVTSPSLARWELVESGDTRLLRLHLREATAEPVSFQITLLRTPVQLANWSFPKLEPVDAIMRTAVVGLLLDERLNAETISTTGVLPIDAAAVGDVATAGETTPRCRPLAAWYAPTADYAVSGNFFEPEPELDCIANALLSVRRHGLAVQGEFFLTPRVERLVEFAFRMPSQWQIESVSDYQGRALAYEVYSEEGGTKRVEVRLPVAVEPGEQVRVDFVAKNVPKGWLNEWTGKRTIRFPNFEGVGTTRTVGAIAVREEDDLAVRPIATDRLVALSEKEKADFGLAAVETRLAYRFDGTDFRATFDVEKTKPRITACTYAFLRIQPDGLVPRYEIDYFVDRAACDELAFVLPKETPPSIDVFGLDDVEIKTYVAEETTSGRRWKVTLKDERRGRVRLVAEFRMPLPEEQLEKWLLPLLEPEAAFRSGFVAVEGHGELEVEIASNARSVDIGELVDAEYQPGRQILGVYSFVGHRPTVIASVRRLSETAVSAAPPAVAKDLKAVSVMELDGAVSTQVTYHVICKTPYLAMQLPGKSELWSVAVDGKPLRPQERDGRLLLSMATDDASAGGERALEVCYRQRKRPLGMWASAVVELPALMLPEQDTTGNRDVPIADAEWSVHVPRQYEVVRWGPRGYRITKRRSPVLLSIAKGFAAACTPIVIGCGAAGMSEPLPTATAPVQDGLEKAVGDFETGAELPQAAEEMPMETADEALAEEEAAEAEPPVPEAPVEMQAAVPRADRDEKRAQVEQPQHKAEGAVMYAGFRTMTFVPEMLPRYYHEVDVRFLGESPSIQIDGVAAGGLEGATWIAVLLIVMFAVVLYRRGFRLKWRWALLLIAAGTFLPLLPGLDMAAPIGDGVVIAVVILMVVDPLWRVASLFVTGVGRLLVGGIVRVYWWAVSSKAGSCILPIVVALACLFHGRAVQSQQPEKSVEHDGVVVQVIDALPPLDVPEDALLVPYDPESGLPRDAGNVWVPYDRYLKLLEATHPRPQQLPKPPTKFAVSPATLTGTASTGDSLEVTLDVEVTVFVDEPVELPLRPAGAGVVEAVVDGKPAVVGLAHVTPDDKTNRQAPHPGGSQVVVVRFGGKGTHRLQLRLQVPLQREGGWRVADFVIGGLPGAQFDLHVPEAETEVRFSGQPDRADYVTSQDGEHVVSAVGMDGHVVLRWRPKILAGRVDRALSTDASILFQVAEEGIRVVWDTAISFPQSKRDAFQLKIPAGWHVLRVEGPNVRGWEWRRNEAGGSDTIEVDLLAMAEDAEHITVELQRGVSIGHQPTQLDVPQLALDGAAISQGTIIVRRSPRLDLQIRETENVTSIDTANWKPSEAVVRASAESPLEPVVHAGYRFQSGDYRITMQAVSKQPRFVTRIDALYRIGTYQRTLEARFDINEVNRVPFSHVRFALPPTMTSLDDVSVPPECSWSTSQSEGRTILHLWMPRGAVQNVNAVATMTLQREPIGGEIDVPAFDFLEGNAAMRMAVLIDPVYRLRPLELEGMRPQPLESASWVRSELRSFVQLILASQAEDVKGRIAVERRKAVVSYDTITNVRFTDRSIEDTVLLDFDIKEAGIRELRFLLPASMQGCRVAAPMVRTEDIVFDEKDPNSPVEVRLTFQDDVMDDLRVLVRNDRLVDDQRHPAPVPFAVAVDDGIAVRAGERYVTLQNVGRDEVVEETAEGVEKLTPERQKELWRRMQIGDGKGFVTAAYRVRAELAQADLAFRVRSRPLAMTSPVRIRMAECLLSLGADGAYRAEQVYWTENRSEQFLVVTLPESARLWTAIVNGNPVKPLVMDGARPERIHVPIVRTAPGDLPYQIQLKYGGTISLSSLVTHVSFPLIEPEDVTPEWSQLRLYLPDELRWLHFDGTMRAVAPEELDAGFTEFEARIVRDLVETARHGDQFSRVRAKQNAGLFSSLTSEYADRRSSGGVIEESLALLQNLGTEYDDQAEGERGAAAQVDNTVQLEMLYRQQRVRRGKNVVERAVSNWGLESKPSGGAEAAGGARDVNTRWFGELVGKKGQAASAASGPMPQDRPTTPPQNAPLQSRRLTSRFEAAEKSKSAPEYKESYEAEMDALGPQRARAADKVKQYEERYSQEIAGFAGGGFGGGVGGEAIAGRRMDREVEQLELGRQAGANEDAAQSFAIGGQQVVPQSQEAGMLFENLTSVDVPIPRQGREYTFIAPQGAARIGAWAVDEDTVSRGRQAGGATVVLVLLLAAGYIVRRYVVKWQRSWWGRGAFLIGGLIGLCLVPAIGLMMLLTAVGATIYHLFGQTEPQSR
ncbi:hypothetical protein JCM19992_25850 [Thermostilla marina]